MTIKLIELYTSLLYQYESEKKIGLKPTLNKLYQLNNLLYNRFTKNILNKNKYEIVVARYNENIEQWKPYQSIITIYNKGKKDLKYDNITLNNVGRESHTYLKHIINNWDNLADITLFTQCNYSYEHKPFPVPLYFTSGLSITIHLWNNIIDFRDKPWGYIKHGGKWLKEYNNGSIRKTNLTFGDWWDKYVQKCKPILNQFKWSHGAIFSVTREQIKKNTKEYYLNLISLIENDINPEEGHYFERSWYYIFNS